MLQVSAKAAAAAATQLEQVKAAVGSNLDLSKAVQHNPQVVQHLLQLVCFNGCSEVQRQAAHMLGSAATGPGSNWQLLEKEPNLVDGLAQLLHSSSDKVQEQGAHALARVAISSKQQHDSLFKAGVLQDLVELLGSPSPQVQLAAAHALQQISHGSKVAAERIGKVPELVPRLAKLLEEGTALHVQAQAAQTIKSLSEQCLANQTKLGAQQEVVGALVNLLRSTSQDAQVAAAQALASLTKDNQTNQRLVVNTSGALSGLVRLLAVDNPAVQTAAALAVAFIVGKASDDVLQHLRQAKGLVPAIVAALHSDAVTVQEAAACVLARMAYGCEQLRGIIGAEPRAIPRLVDLLRSSNNGTPHLVHPAVALLNLAARSCANTSRIVDTTGALELLVQCLQRSDPQLQYKAAIVIDWILYDHPAAADRIGSIQGLPLNIAALLRSAHGGVQAGP
jgi:HEAT repeat protein